MGRPLLAVACALGAALGALGSALPVMPAPPAAAAGSGRGQPTMSLQSQTPWVGPGQDMVLHLAMRGAPLSSLSLTLTLYGHLTSRSAFAETAGGTPVGRVLSSASVPADSLPADSQGVTVSVPVSSGDAPAGPGGPFTAELECAPGACGGVYPLRLQLSSNGTTVQSLFTYLVYANPPPTTQKVRLAWLLPLALPTSVPSSTDASAGTGPGPQLDSASLGQLSGLLAAVAAHPTVPLTFDPSPATVAALAGSSRQADRAALASMQALAAPGARQVMSAPYVPVDAAALVSAGLNGELAEQARRGDQALAPLHPSGGTWLASGPVDEAALALLGTLGDNRVVVPASDVSQAIAPTLSATSPFTLAAGRGVAPLAVESDSQLSTDTSAPGDGPLGGYRMLADLALLYYEQPNDSTARGVVLAPAGGAPLDPATVDTVLGALSGDPLVAPVTLDQLFAQVPTSSVSRRLSAAAVTAAVPARQIRVARGRLNAFTSSVNAAGAAVARALDERLLWSEDDQLRPAQQQLAVSAFSGALGLQLSTVSIRADTIKLTSTAAKVPLTIVKQSGYGMSAILRVTGDKVAFPSGSAQDPGPVCRSWQVRSSAVRSTFTCVADIALATNAVYVDMRARVAGDFRLDVSLSSPTGGLVIASTHVTVHSMSTSLVAVVLSAAALGVLLLWWLRTVRRRRPPGRGAHVRRRAPSPPVGVS